MKKIIIWENLTEDSTENVEKLLKIREKLRVFLDEPILCIGDLGLWDGRHMGYKQDPSGLLARCLYGIGEYFEFHIDEHNDLRATDIHHDGTNFYTYRVWKPSMSLAQRDNLLEKLYLGTATRKDILRKTNNLGKIVKELLEKGE